MGRGFCILLMVLSLCACGAKNALPESESVSSQTECVQMGEESAGQTADDRFAEVPLAQEPSVQEIPESKESGPVQGAQSGPQAVQPDALDHAAQTAPAQQLSGDVPPEKAETAAPATESSAEKAPAESAEGEPNVSSKEESTLKITVGEDTLFAVWEDNSSAEAFRELLSQGPLTIEMEDYGGFEKVGALGTTLPRNDIQITTQPGDVILYQGNQITIYYGTNTWNFTRLARITDPDDLQETLGAGTVSITFSLE
ncbi:cyclophilin-like fold protein [Dysosmobacter sp.]|jgi:hypothetical protein|uniref:cyclophilin-like fold protein n=1 Tax=Dysosmobacter sp. TaxID=2591382 RepID=UPI003D8A3F3A